MLTYRHVRGAAGLLLIVLSAGIGLGEPSCPGTATVTLFINNKTGAPVDLAVEGELASDATCEGAGAITYGDMPLHCEAGDGPCGTIEGLRPGAWVHRMSVTVPDSDTQEQAQRAVLVTGEPVGSNVVVWTVYPRTFVVTTTASDDTPGGLRATLSAAGDYTSTSPGPALIIFSRVMFPGPDLPQTIALSGDACDPDTHHAALCFRHSRIVLDALDRNARPGGLVWSVGTNAESLLRVYGSENVFRGIVFQGSAAEVVDPTTCGEAGGPPQADTVAVTGPEAHDNTLEHCLVLGPTCGDGIGVDDGATNTLVTRSRIADAQDKGLKANAASVKIEDSCVHGNDNGGIQSTLGGNVEAKENVVQDNAGGAGQNGLTVIDQCRADNPGCTHEVRSGLVTVGNIVRFSGGRGISVASNAHGTFDSDYVANNAVKGAVVETTERVPIDADGQERVPSASFRGVGLVCNYSDGFEGVGAEVRLELGHDPPNVFFGEVDSPGSNAFTSNRGFILGAGANFLLTNVTSPISAVGNQWGSCSDTICDGYAVGSTDIRPPSPPNVTLGAATFSGPRGGAPVIDRVVPARPAAGDIVRIYGENFDAINGNPTRGASCDSVSIPECSPTNPCSTGPCVDGRCPCSIDNPAVHDRNTRTPTEEHPDPPEPPNRIRIRAVGGVDTLLADIPPDAVTPTMLAFRMPFDCFGQLQLEVAKEDQSVRIPICDPMGCRDQPADVPCDDGDPLTVADRCDGGGECVGEPTTTTTAMVTTTTMTVTSTTASTSTTSTTLAQNCGCVPVGCDVDQCAVPRLHRKAKRIARAIKRRCEHGRQPTARIERLTALLTKCAGAS